MTSEDLGVVIYEGCETIEKGKRKAYGLVMNTIRNCGVHIVRKDGGWVIHKAHYEIIKYLYGGANPRIGFGNKINFNSPRNNRDKK